MNSQDKSTPKIGIVIPIYNVAKYLRECLDSVVNQTYGNFCAVLVNDGSTDFLEGESTSQSLQIALEYVTKDSRFVLIDKKNGGLSSARNAGIKYFSQIIDSTLSTQEANSSIFDEKSGLRSHERGNRTSRSLTKRVASLPDLSLKDNAHFNPSPITYYPIPIVSIISK